MRKWTSVLALAVGGALIATMAVAQTGSSTAPSTSGTGSDTATSGSASGGMKSDTGKSDTGMKSDTMKSDTMKSDTMKSDSMKSDMSKSRGTRGARGGDREQVRAVQQALKDKGHDPGNVDGVMGPKTRSALRDFQKKEGIKDTGQLDQDTMSKLGVETKTSSGGASSTGTSASPATTGSGPSTPSATSGPSTPDKSSTDTSSPTPKPGGADKK
jgi:peptidoglycan hydrolase-like protein with peptidoglycan-binding domain